MRSVHSEIEHTSGTGFDAAGIDPVGLPEGFWEDLSDNPYAHDLFRVLRWLDARAGARKPLGRAGTPRDEPLRMRQTPSMAFAPSTLSAVSCDDATGLRELSIYSFGLFGPNGPLPLHLTEYARGRLHHHGDDTLTAFADLFHHRLILLFYRAWADAQSTVSLDHAGERFSRYMASLLHMDTDGRDSVPNHAKYYMAGHLLRQTRNPEGLQQILHTYFAVPVHIREFIPQWIRLESGQQLMLGDTESALGRSTLLGVAVRDAQHKFRIELGPLRIGSYMQFLPGASKAQQLLDWVRQYVGLEYEWDVQLVLDQRDVHGLALGQSSPLGLSTWLGLRDQQQGDARDVLLNLEQRMGVA
ncbi:type VI secretion system baseplate subunit TssG [Pollutimonas harenae]|uniref:Type VI secretion system baseplate subunit TssG n=1 Tax=Pollutimonas harenae TaxID=657015 RepID=A0A853GTJ1_9BURK|nr:type VI secretion system baseplate subunit TssG [Pollutimonas harenae]NYT86478.1 type VI secretion system baseplate subunit TssG [Pollutimonas harenae]TEA69777.1 type VI secretion system baseplate subunit TssG [Pollutimonas harenae]